MSVGQQPGESIMMAGTIHKIISLVMIVGLIPALLVGAQQSKNPRYPDTLQGESVERLTRGNSVLDKLTSELQSLYRQFAASRDKAAKDNKFSDAELKKRFGINRSNTNPSIEVAIEITPDNDTTTLEKAGATIRLVSNQTVYASLPVLNLETLAGEETVISISSVKAARLPEIPKAQKAPQLSLPDLTRGALALADKFDAQRLTGKGVIIGILDTGIDWRHQDFINADGTSRILYLYDPFDTSFTTSQGKIGSRPPINDAKEKPLGTLYTREQINAALRGQDAINSTDKNGHGTAVAGTAAGNGRATANGVPAGTYKGTAPEADLIIVKVVSDSPAENLFPYYMAAKWIVETAKAANQACVLNLSLGNHYSAHDGNDAVEAMFNELAGDGKQGVVICVAAGNEGKFSFHAGGTFGPRRTGQADVISPAIELFVARQTQFSAYFDHADDWGLIVSGLDNFFVDDKGNSLDAYFYNVEGRFQTKISANAKAPASFSQFVQNAVEIEAPMKSSKSMAKSSVKPFSTSSTISSVNQRNATSDRLVLTLQPGKYTVRGFGATQRVTNGRFDLYLDSYSEASFGNGAEAKFMIASPGNAANVLTVGAYDFRNQWENGAGKQTSYNLNVGDLSDYSSPGYRRDGAIKPDITAPATYTIASLATGSALAKDGDGNLDQTIVTRDGLHLAWSGTSAASPYVAGVVALLLQKNARLDASQIRDLLARTASKDQFTGAVPNPRWGYGKINPDAAINATHEDLLPLEASASAKSSSTSSATLAATLAVRVTAREELILQAGKLQGVTKGSRFALHAAEAADFKNARPIAEAEITELDNTTATLTLTEAFKNRLAVSDLKFVRAIEVAHQYGDNRLKVLAQSLETLANGKALIEQLQTLPLVNLVNEANEKWDVRFRSSTTNRPGAQILLERQDGSLLRQFTDDGDLLPQIRHALESESRSHFLKALENRDGDSQIKIELRVAPVEVELDDEGRVRRVIANKEISQTSKERMILTEGDFVMLEIKNTGSAPAYVTVFDLRSDGLIAPLFPHPSIKVYDNKISVSDHWQRIPLPFIFHIEKPYGAEIFKAIATRDKTDFSMLLDAETLARSSETEAARSPLGQLLKAAATGQRGGLAAVPPAGWATASTAFKVVAHKD
jgi:subtilisin family serine protease